MPTQLPTGVVTPTALGPNPYATRVVVQLFTAKAHERTLELPDGMA